MINFRHISNQEDVQMLLKLMPLYYEYDGHSFDLNKATTAVENLVSNNNLGQAWLITTEKEKEPIGYIVITFGFSLECGGRESFIDELFLLEQFRGKGFGSLAIKHAISKCRKEDIRAVRLEVTRDNLNALNLYKKLGFKDLERFLLTNWLN